MKNCLGFIGGSGLYELDFLENRKFLDLYFSKEYDLSNINQAIHDFKSKSEIKLIINN